MKTYNVKQIKLLIVSDSCINYHMLAKPRDSRRLIDISLCNVQMQTQNIQLE